MMKSAYLKLALPMALATVLANADELNFTKNLPLDSKSKIMMIDENPFTTYDHRVSFNAGLFGEGISYSYLKPKSGYFGVGTSVNSHGVAITAMGGYNFLLTQKDILRPMAGLGYYTGNKHHHTFFPMWGIEYDHAFNSTFSVGADFINVATGNFNYVIGVPFTFHFGDEKKWEIQLTPWMTHRESWPSSNYSTSLSCSLGYRF